MHKTLTFIAYGWLTLAGILHFVVDVVAQHVRHQRPPGIATTLYDGLNTSYALSQLLVGVFGLIVAQQALPVLSRWPSLVLIALATAAWVAISVLFIEYREPKIVIGIFAALAIAMAATR